jgi:hypothetical protein
MCFVRLRIAPVLVLLLLTCWPTVASSTALVTGNGFGFAVVSPQTGAATKFFAHPYSFFRPDPKDPLSEGIETTNFVKNLHWGGLVSGASSEEYVKESNIIRVRNSAGEALYFMPFGLRQTALVINWSSGKGGSPGEGWKVEWNRPVQSQKYVRILGLRMRLLKFEGIEESLLLVPLEREQASIEAPKQYLSGSTSWALISIENESDVRHVAREFVRWRGGLSAAELSKREIREIESWRVKPTIRFVSEQERRLWRQSEIVLRMAQSREPNRPGRYSNGMIVACLPDGSWFMPWVRDMAYAAVALARMGHREEARSALLAYFNARPTGKMREQTGGLDYQVSVVRYFGDGSEEPFFTMEGSTNIEYDNWGLVLWVLGEYVHRFHDPALLRVATYRGTLYESARDYVVKPLLANLEKYDQGLIVAADTSIWEERQKDKKHFAYSTAAAIAGLRSFAETARLAGDESTRNDLLKKVALLEKGFVSAFIRDGKLRGTLEEGIKNDMDGALLSVINFGVVTDAAIVRDTVERMDLLKVASGGYRRVRSTYTDPSIYEYWYERQEFLFVDFNLAEVNWRLGRNAEGDAILRRIVEKAASDHNFIPEMYVAEDCRLFHGAIGDPTGAIPMVGYGAGTYVLEILQRASLEKTDGLAPHSTEFVGVSFPQ